MCRLLLLCKSSRCTNVQKNKQHKKVQTDSARKLAAERERSLTVIRQRRDVVRLQLHRPLERLQRLLPLPLPQPNHREVCPRRHVCRDARLWYRQGLSPGGSLRDSFYQTAGPGVAADLNGFSRPEPTCLFSICSAYHSLEVGSLGLFMPISHGVCPPQQLPPFRRHQRVRVRGLLRAGAEQVVEGREGVAPEARRLVQKSTVLPITKTAIR